MRTKPVESWRIPNQLQSSKITGEAEKVQTPLGGLIGYRARDRPSVQGLRPIDIGQQTTSPGQAFDTLLGARNRAHVPSVKNQVKYEESQSWKDLLNWKNAVPYYAGWPANIGDTRTIGDPKIPKEEGPVKPGDVPRRTLEIPKPTTPPPPITRPPRNSPVNYSLSGFEMFIGTRKRRRYKRVRG